ncbi:MAG: BA14K family protein [Mesorhizobium sp.]
MAAAVAITGVVPASSAPVVVQQTAPSSVKMAQFDYETDRQMRRQNRNWRSERRNWRGDQRRWAGQRQWRGDNRPGWYRGHRGYRHKRPGYRYHDGWWFPAGAFIAGAIISGAVNSAQQPRYNRSYSSAHVRWCYNRYRSYRDWDNTFQPYNGPRQQCYSPYS